MSKGRYAEDHTITFTDGVATVELTHGQSITIIGLPVGISYTVTESNNDGYTVTSTGATGTIPDDGTTVTAEFTNSRDLPIGDLTVTKTVTGTARDKSKEFHFTVELNDKSINGTYGQMTFTDGVAEFTLKHGGSITATGLPAGIRYTVTETEANQDGYTTFATDKTGTIPGGGTATAAFENAKNETPPETGGLTVSKTVTGNAGDKTKEFHFRVELSDTGINGTYGDMTFVNGAAEFTLKHGGSITATGLPAGIRYTVTETEANQDGYTTTPTDGATASSPLRNRILHFQRKRARGRRSYPNWSHITRMLILGILTYQNYTVA